MVQEGVSLAQQLAGAVKVDQVHSLLTARRATLLDEAHPDHSLYRSLVAGVANEIAPYAGAFGTARRGLAAWCLTLGVASQLEAALFPEQQNEQGRAQYLEGRFAKILGQLRDRMDGDTGASVADDAPEPVGQFPADSGVHGVQPGFPDGPGIYRRLPYGHLIGGWPL